MTSQQPGPSSPSTCPTSTAESATSGYYLDKLIDELAKGKKMASILRQ